MTQEIKLQNELEMLLDDVSHGMESEIVSIRDQIHQIKTLLIDAIASLHESFENIDNQSSQQMKLFTSMISEVVDVPESSGQEQNIFQHVAAVEKVLTELLDTLVKDSRRSLGAINRMNETVNTVKIVAVDEKSVSELLNSIHVEASSESPDFEKIRDLSSAAVELNNGIIKKRKEMSESCTQSRLLVDNLASRDMDKVFTSKAKVEEILAHLNKTNSLISDCRTQANSVNSELRLHLGSAIRALQFEDIVSQSLGHTELHLERMDGFVSRVATGIAELHSKSETTLDEYVIQLSVLHEEIMTYRNSLRLEETNPISQESMDEGDVELF